MKYENTAKSIIAGLPWLGHELLSWPFETAVLVYCWLITLTVLEYRPQSTDSSDTDASEEDG